MALWALIPAFTFDSLPLDVVENLAWGQEWEWGYYKHPPLQAWLSETFFILFGGMDIGLYVLAQLAIILTYIGIWKIAKAAAGPRLALISILAFSLLYYANIPSVEFNANTLQMPIWAWSIYVFGRAIGVLEGKHSPRLLWPALGVLLALAFYAKYSALVLVLSLIVITLILPEGRKSLFKPELYIGAALCLLLITPHIIWIFQSEFVSIDYYQARSIQLNGMQRVFQPLSFTLTQILDHVVVILFVCCAFWGSKKTSDRKVTETLLLEEPKKSALRFIYFSATLPLFWTIALSIVQGAGLKDMWGAPLFTTTTLAALLFFKLNHPKHIGKALKFWLIVFISLPIGLGVLTEFGMDWDQKPRRTNAPAEHISEAIEEIWDKHVDAPLEIVAGNTWLTGLVSTYVDERPHVYVQGKKAYNPWIEDLEPQIPIFAIWQNEGGRPALVGLGNIKAEGQASVPYDTYSTPLSFDFHWAIITP
jgi:4-amino-4-deoxy-L-arabinose transferase-like glycosyltransferase